MPDYYIRGRLIPKGERGYSAYEIAVQQGFIGTEEEWIASLHAGTEAIIVQEIASTSSNGTIPSTLAVWLKYGDALEEEDIDEIFGDEEEEE